MTELTQWFFQFKRTPDSDSIQLLSSYHFHLTFWHQRQLKYIVCMAFVTFDQWKWKSSWDLVKINVLRLTQLIALFSSDSWLNHFVFQRCHLLGRLETNWAFFFSALNVASLEWIWMTNLFDIWHGNSFINLYSHIYTVSISLNIWFIAMALSFRFASFCLGRWDFKHTFKTITIYQFRYESH